MTTMIPILLAATIPIRNPFWPVGYQGELEAISGEPRIEATEQVEAPATAENAAAVQETVEPSNDEEDLQLASKAKQSERRWIAARKTLKIGAMTMYYNEEDISHQAIMINGKIYADGDLISVNHENRRFTWKVKNLTKGGTLKLQRIKFRELDEEADDKGN